MNPARYHHTRHKGDAGELATRFVFQHYGYLPIPTKYDGVHGPDLLYLLDRDGVPPVLDPFCGAGMFSLLMLEAKAGMGLMRRRNWTTLLAGKGDRRQMGPAWRAVEIGRFRKQGGAAARALRTAGNRVMPAMAILDPTPGSECIALVRIDHTATREIGPRAIIANETLIEGFGATVRAIWPRVPEVSVMNAPWSSSTAMGNCPENRYERDKPSYAIRVVSMPLSERLDLPNLRGRAAVQTGPLLQAANAFVPPKRAVHARRGERARARIVSKKERRARAF